VKHFDTGKAKAMFGGAWLIDMGILSAAEQQAIVDLHYANTHGALWRKPSRCECEMSKLQWVDARDVLAAIEAHKGENAITVGALSSRFRSWTTEFYVSMAKRSAFREFCLRKGEPHCVDVCRAGAAPATIGKKGKIAAGTAGTKSSVATQEDVKLLDSLLQSAKYDGEVAETWATIFRHLKKQPKLVNKRNGRSFTFLHHAAYWDHSDAVRVLISDFKADSQILSADGETPAQVAESMGSDRLAALIRELSL